MSLITKDWEDFQHYKDRRPPWIKLYRTLLDDPDFHCLPIASRALAPMLWLLASESINGVIDLTVPQIAFRLRCSVKDVEDGLKPLVDNGFFIDASGMLAECLQHAIPETETEVEIKKEIKKEANKKRGSKKDSSIIPAEFLEKVETLCRDWYRTNTGRDGEVSRLSNWSDPVDLWEALNKHFPKDDKLMMLRCGLVYLNNLDERKEKTGITPFAYAMTNFYGPKNAYWKTYKESVLQAMESE